MKSGLYRILKIFLICMISITTYSAYSIYAYSLEFSQVKTDAAIVLGAAVWDDEVSPVFTERINHAIMLYEEDYIDTIIFTGGRSDEDRISEAEAAREYAIQNGVADEDILIETDSKITEENLKNAYGIGKDNEFESYSIVSDPLHMKRAMVMAEYLGMEAYSSPTQTSAYKTMRSKIPFLLREVFYYIGYYVSVPFR